MKGSRDKPGISRIVSVRCSHYANTELASSPCLSTTSKRARQGQSSRFIPLTATRSFQHQAGTARRAS